MVTLRCFSVTWPHVKTPMLTTRTFKWPSNGSVNSFQVILQKYSVSLGKMTKWSISLASPELAMQIIGVGGTLDYIRLTTLLHSKWRLFKKKSAGTLLLRVRQRLLFRPWLCLVTHTFSHYWSISVPVLSNCSHEHLTFTSLYLRKHPRIIGVL